MGFDFISGIDWFPLWLSLRVATVATVLSLIFGLTVAFLLAKYDFRGKDLIDAIVTLPIVLPPTVLGYYLLVLLGRNSPIGDFYENLTGSTLVFTWQGAVIAAFIASVPFLIRTSRAAIESIDPDLEKAARTLGLSEVTIALKITLPLAWRGILAGTVLAYARALGEFGATLMIAGNIPGQTQTMAIAIYDAVQSGDGRLAIVLTVVLSLAAILSLLVVGRVARTRI